MTDTTTTTDGFGDDRLFGPMSDAEVASLLSQTPTRALEEGATLPAKVEDVSCDGDFRFFKRIGAGGQGEVWLARQEELHRMVAVKVLLGHDEESFRKEAMVAGALDHPNIIPIHQMCRVERYGADQPALAMKLARGTPWSRLIRQEHPGDGEKPSFSYLSRHLRIFIAMCNALAYAHDRGIIHRDIKPSQVIVGEYGEVYLTDWGMAIVLVDEFTATRKLDEGASGLMPTRESSSVACGTPAYMAPEQVDTSNDRIGRHTDIYLLGGVLFEILTGHPPREVSVYATAMLAIHENKHRLVPKDAPEELQAIIKQCFSTRPEARPESVLAVRKAVEEYIDGIGKQEDSRKLSDEVARKVAVLDETAYDYKTVGSLIQQANAARDLWPGNPEAEQLRRKLVVLQIEHALRQRDLGFARGACVGLPAEDETRVDLERRIAEADLQQKRHARQRRLALAASFLLLLIVIIGAVGFAHQQQKSRKAIEDKNVQLAEQRDIADARRQEAQEARDDMETTLEEVLYELDIPLRSVDRLESLHSIAQLGLQYYQNKDVGTLTPEDLRMQAWTYLRLSDVFAATLDLDKARSAVKNALELQVKAFRETNKETYLADLIIGKESLVSIEALRGDIGEWERNLTEAHRYASALASQSPKPYHASRQLWLACMASHLAFQEGNMEQGRQLHDEAKKLFEKLEQLDSDDQSMAQNLENADSMIGVLAVKYLDDPSGLARIQRAIDGSISRRDPSLQDPYQLQDLVRLRMRKAQALLALNRCAEGLDTVDQALKEQRHLAAAREDNLSRSYTLGELTALAAELALCAGDNDGAISYANESIETLLTLEQLENPPFRIWEYLATAHWAKGEARLAEGDASAADDEFAKAWQDVQHLDKIKTELDGAGDIWDRIQNRIGP
ncbi:serine/threonine protein kinase [bacterium]|nr:serine/threonine protein kinase [bacterium]